MRETDINGHLAAVLQVFSDSIDSTRFLPPSINRFYLISDANMLAQNVQQVLSNFWQ